jgi:uncharacterized protein YndB with AHSA1/START domain
MDKVIHVTARLACNPSRAFEMFTDNPSVERWLTVHAEIEPRVGGKYELFWNPEDRVNDSTIGCKVLVCDRSELLAFEWKGPKELKDLNSERPLTTVVVCFVGTREGTVVHLVHSGWRDSERWSIAYEYFVRNWKSAFERLERVVTDASPTN